MGPKIGGKIEKLNGKELSYTEFAENFMARNQPVLLTGLMDNWRACKDWVSDDGKPDFNFFSAHFSNSRVQVAVCGEREFSDQKRREMTVSEFIEQWRNRTSGDNSLLYLKDWHFVKEYPEYVAYSTPTFFSDDWLNLYLDKYRMHNDPEASEQTNEIDCSDYRFVYMGAKGTWTPLHADVFRSYSWSANVCGRKMWYFLPPSQNHLVFDRNMKNSVYDILEDISETKFPGFNKAVWWECIQEENEIIFVPSGWYHQLHNLWDLLLKEYHEASECIEDIKDICDNFEELCQRNLAANAGMNFHDLFIFIVRFAFANSVLLYHLKCKKHDIRCSASQVAQLIYFNLKSIQSIAVKMKSSGMWESYGISIDFRSTIQDSNFLQLCDDLGRAYGMIFDERELKYDIAQSLLEEKYLNFLHSFGSQICNPKDLARFIDFFTNPWDFTLEENCITSIYEI